MPATLLDDATRAVLDRLFTAAAQEGPALLALRDRFSGDVDVSLAPVVAEAAAEIYMPVAPEVGRLLYLLTRTRNAALVVEFGTSFGISTIYLAAAAKDNGGGVVVGSELDPSKHAKAREHLRQAGLDRFADVRLGDALVTLADVAAPIDLVLLDGWKDAYLPILKLLKPKLRPRAVVLADNIYTFKKALRPYVEYMQDGANGFVSTTLDIADGFEMSVYTG